MNNRKIKFIAYIYIHFSLSLVEKSPRRSHLPANRESTHSVCSIGSPYLPTRSDKNRQEPPKTENCRQEADFCYFLLQRLFKQHFICMSKKSTSRQRSGKGAIRKRFPLQKPRWEKTKLTIRYLYHETIVSRMGSYFPNRWPLSYLNLTKNMKTYIRRQQHKKKFKHQDIKQKEPPQKYRLGTISNTKLLAGLNRFYMAITSPSASAVVHNI